MGEYRGMKTTAVMALLAGLGAIPVAELPPTNIRKVSAHENKHAAENIAAAKAKRARRAGRKS